MGSGREVAADDHFHIGAGEVLRDRNDLGT
jgi:hypothetical protein